MYKHQEFPPKRTVHVTLQSPGHPTVKFKIQKRQPHIDSFQSAFWFPSVIMSRETRITKNMSKALTWNTATSTKQNHKSNLEERKTVQEEKTSKKFLKAMILINTKHCIHKIIVFKTPGN